MSIMVGTGRGAEAGVLIRNAEALEAFEKVDTLVVDKTGTLTEGKPRLVTLILRWTTTKPVLRLAASPGAGKRASAGRRHRRRRTASVVCTLARAEDFQSITGQGVSARPPSIGNAKSP